MTEEFQRDFIHDYLGPMMELNHPEIKLLIFDHNKNNMTSWVDTVLKPPKNMKYVDGVAFHWYSGLNDREMDGTYGYDETNLTHHRWPDKILLATEGCSCPGVQLNDWFRAERFAHDVIFDLLSHVQGWVDWNLLLDAEGGPNHKGNTCDAPIIATEDFSSIVVQPKFYYMGHISKFVPPGSRRIAGTVVGNFNYASFDPKVRAGFEAGLFSCERSPRQTWQFSDSGTFALKDASLQDDVKRKLCISGGVSDRQVIRMDYCEENEYSAPLQLSHEDGSSIRETVSGKCFSVFGGSLESGALLELVECKKNEVKQQFNINSTTGEVTSVLNGYCLTAGWPFLTGASFIDNVESTITVLMNESPLDSEVILHDGIRDQQVLFGINGRSIQTIVYN